MQTQGNPTRLICGRDLDAIRTGAAYYSSGDPDREFRDGFGVSDANGLDAPKYCPAGSTKTYCWTCINGDGVGVVVQSVCSRGGLS